MNDKDDDEIDEAFLRRKRRKSNNILPILGIMAVFMAPGLFAVLVYIVQSNKTVAIPEVIQQHQDRPQIIPPASSMGEVYGRLAIYGGVALVGIGGLGVAISKGASSQRNWKSSRLTIIQWVFVYTLPMVVLSLPLAYFASQYRPVFGDFVTTAIAKPHSPAREALIPIHMFGFGLAAIAVGSLFGILTWLSKK